MWPNYFPPKCPPNDAREDELRVYGLVGGSPLSEKDFLPSVIEHPHRTFEEEKVCISCGVSVFKDMKDAIKRRNRFRPLRAKKLAVGTVKKHDGFILETLLDSHITWWLLTSEPHRNFVEVDENASS